MKSTFQFVLKLVNSYKVCNEVTFQFVLKSVNSYKVCNEVHFSVCIEVSK
jgi:hypothetical protein